MTLPLFVDWHQAADAAPGQIGGKAMGLARLWRYGFRVPPGGVLTVAACRLLMNNHPAAIDALDHGLERLGLKGMPLAVRSSAMGEDGRDASFAGIHRSLLNVQGRDDVLRAVRACWDSAFAAPARGYRQRLGMTGEPEMAVVIMAMAPTRVSGIAFSCDPRDGREDRVFIAANDGLGESVVGGLCDPDEMVVQVGFHAPMMELVEYRLGRKEKQSLAQAGGGTIVGDGSAIPHQCLPDAACLTLARQVVRVRDAVGGGEIHQDVEWSWDGTHFWLLQARPVTTLPRHLPPQLTGQPDVWSNGNFRDSMPTPFPPLAWSMGQHLITRILEAGLKAAQIPTLPGLTRAKLIKGRGYFRIPPLQWEYWDGFGFAPAITNRLLGGHQGEIEVTPPQGWRHRLRRLGANLRMGKQVSQAQRDSQTRFATIQAIAEAVRLRDRSNDDDAAIVAEMQGLSARFGDDHGLHLLKSAAAGSYLMLSALLERFVPGEGQALAQALLTDGAHITSAAHGQDLARLATLATSEPQAMAMLQGNSPWRNLPSDSAFRRGMEDFLRAYGHRAIYELDIANPRWREDQSWLLSTIAAMTGHDGLAQMAERRRQLRHDALRRVPWFLRRLAGKLAAKAAHEAALREMAKSSMVRMADAQRHLALELGQRLTARGILPDRDAIFFLTIEDLADLTDGQWDGGGAAHLIADRRRQHEEWLTQIPADVIEDDCPRQVTSTDGATTDGWSGLPVAAGRASGPACRLTTPNHADRLQSGHVLVAPSTDPGWTPLFLRIGALVTETGGFISHGAIVAREYGIPAVVNVPGIMTKVADGTMLTVDGNRGRVGVTPP